MITQLTEGDIEDLAEAIVVGVDTFLRKDDIIIILRDYVNDCKDEERNYNREHQAESDSEQEDLTNSQI